MKATLIKSENSYILKDGLNHVLGIDDKKLKDRLECPYLLSKQNCDEIFGIVDVEKLAENKYGKGIYEIEQVDAYIEGFNKAMELNKDKVFTLEDIKKAYIQGKHGGKTQAYVEFDDYIQSLQQPTEIEVEIEMEQYGYCEGCRKSGMWHCAHADTCGYAETREKPKLDSEGCLILKRVV
jgi:hypothetical protein